MSAHSFLPTLILNFSNAQPTISRVASSNPVLYSNVTCEDWATHVTQCVRRPPIACIYKVALDCFSTCQQVIQFDFEISKYDKL